MKKAMISLILVVVFAAVGIYSSSGADYSDFKNGDLIFQTSRSSQSSAIFFATSHAFTHMGIIKKAGNDIYVIEAAAKVQETPLQHWIKRGVLKRYAVYRDSRLSSDAARQIIASAAKYRGKPYDIFFSFDNDAIYCSELPFLAYKDVGLSIGKPQKVSELNFDNFLVKNLIKKRWTRYPNCIKRGFDFEECYNYILNQELVTPVSIANDRRFQQVYSNYPL